MAGASSSATRIQGVWVTGDQTIDWVLEPQGKHVTRSPDERLHIHVRAYWHAGGAFQLAALTRAALKGTGQKATVKCQVDPKQNMITAYMSPYSHSFANLRKYGSGVHRIELFLGFRRHDIQPEPAPLRFTRTNTYANAPVILIDDADLGFRKDRGYWSKVLEIAQEDSCKWLVLKMSHNLKDGPDGTFWHRIRKLLESDTRWLKDKLIVITAASRMRDAEAEISRGLSWDQSAQDVLYEIGNHEKLRTLRACPRLIVSFGPSGAMLLQHDEHLGEDAFHWELIYNRELMEREWANQHRDGKMFGYGSALCAAVASELVRTNPSPDYHEAIKRGLVAMQKIYETGFKIPPVDDVTKKSRHFSFCDDVFKKLDEHELYKQLRVSDTSSTTWPPRIKKDDYKPIIAKSKFEGHEVARKGKAGLPENVPVGSFGKLVTVDHEEIESLHEIYNLIDGYCGNPRFDAKPLAIAVFGAPGAGKGYAIKQLAEPWMKGEGKNLLTPLEFNLSQLNSASELIGALHQVRDVALGGKIPLVLWDEFDSPLQNQPLGWLRYFLAPIQDGKFQQEEQTHLIGPCIFVFAGGTSETFTKFKKAAKDTQIKGVKGEDFLSRLRGYVDIYGINSSPGSRAPQSNVILRRALILHSLFKEKGVAENGDAIDVDSGVLEAFLTVPRYEHGVRSMDQIIEMSNLRRKEPYSRSALPSREQLMLHVDGDRFLEIMRGYRHS